MEIINKLTTPLTPNNDVDEIIIALAYSHSKAHLINSKRSFGK